MKELEKSNKTMEKELKKLQLRIRVCEEEEKKTKAALSKALAQMKEMSTPASTPAPTPAPTPTNACSHESSNLHSTSTSFCRCFPIDGILSRSNGRKGAANTSVSCTSTTSTMYMSSL